MITNFTETKTRVTKNVTANSGIYSLSASAVIENGILVSLSGVVSSSTSNSYDMTNIAFDAYWAEAEGVMKVNYHNIPASERDTLDIISAMVDAIVAKYQA